MLYCFPNLLFAVFRKISVFVGHIGKSVIVRGQ